MTVIPLIRAGLVFIAAILTCCESKFALAQPIAGEKAILERPADWATPVELSGVPNLHRVSDDLFRSAQPNAEGMQHLRKLGIETIVNLRSFHSDRDDIGETGLAYEHIYMKAWHPEDKEILRFLQIVTNTKRQPVLVHCQHGADRTGLMCALYRITIQGWGKERAIEEMVEGGYGFSPVWVNLINYIRSYDVDSMRTRLTKTTRMFSAGKPVNSQTKPEVPSL